MNWFLLLIILLMGGAGYYEYQTLHGQITVDDMQVSDLKTKLQLAAAGEQQSADNVTQLTSSLTAVQAKVVELQKQLQDAKSGIFTGQPSTALPATSTTIAAAPMPFTTKLGTITALDGKTYSACQLLKVNCDNIVVSDADGVTQIALNVLPAPMQKMFGFDAKLGPLSNDQVAALEQQRQMAAASGH